ncbi:MAG TPA: S9 family peptidase [Parabacteroides johnsonii]|jgi:dipeptidyl aminopeptidase/acylaminoacyl peptidase|nr:DPP IV N-terminal domain-containing protein [Parabacteroides johnsonii]UEA91711.1 S9 family peptidase [Parabacteroides johnsonii]UWP43865.1 S9 family peptidase [Parabacteroides johnsonii DSM 18315]HJH00576.1 S9 family peptidase [Parabacteroides johnsonii]
MKKQLLLVMLCAGMFCGTEAQGQETERLSGYVQAERFTKEKLNTMLFSTSVDPHWFQKGNNFWYEYKTSNGKAWYVVDPVAKTKRSLFDLDDIAAQITEIVKDPFTAQQLPIQKLEAGEDGRTFTFQITSSQDAKKDSTDKDKGPKKEIFFFSYDYPTRKLTWLQDKKKETEYPDWASFSPDGKTVVYAKDLNLYRMSREDYEKLKKDDKDSTVTDIQLTTFGVKDFGFGQPYSLLNTDTLCNGKRKAVWGIVWSPDSRYFAVTATDERAVKDLWVINSMASPRPTLETYKYQMPGEKEAPVEHLFLFDMNDNSHKEIRTSAFKDQTLRLARKPWRQKDRDRKEVASVWLGDNNRFFVTRSSRDLHRIDICSYTIGQDSIRPIIEERMNTYQEVRPLATIGDGKELIQWSERDGWAHLYLYDGEGNLKNRITRGPWHVDQIVKVDEAKRVVYFLANGKDKDENPYYEHLYRVGLDGSGLQQVTPGDYFHTVSMDDNAAFVVNNYSRVNTIPRTDLMDSNGRKLMTLEESDFSGLLAAGYQFPEPFKVKAADGVTDLYGVMYKPFNFDSTALYPIIDYVYPGPQVEATVYPFSRMSVRTDRLAQAGFVVITVGNRGGHPSRSKWYHNFGYGNLRDYGLADQKAAIEQLANRYPFIDINRVGIHGHSGGGFMSTAAILQYPDFFKAAVSCAGNHDNRIYNRWWSETHHGVKEVVSEKGDTTFVYNIKTNEEIAGRLKGHLMLVHGDIDNNVHPGNTLRVADALIRAGKRFDMLLLPQQRHGFGDMDEYFYWRMVDYFSRNLLGEQETSVDIPKR